jgi:hypothetical protein
MVEEDSQALQKPSEEGKLTQIGMAVLPISQLNLQTWQR